LIWVDSFVLRDPLLCQARIVKSGKINSITTQLFIGDLANGLYLIILKKQNGTTYKQKIILTK